MKNDLSKENTGFLVEDMSGLYKIVLHHDEFSTRDFVLEVLEKFFYMDRQNAVVVMQEAAQYGRAFCGLFSGDVAATKIQAITDCATSKEFPLVCSMEAA
jgi:ATP-dependent Clp protease adaptor protein ClpS